MARTFIAFLRFVALGSLLGLAPVAPAAAKEAAPIEASARQLRPGGFVWQPERASGGPVEVVISLGSQKAYVYRGGTLIGVSTVSSGKTGHESPTGRFQILQKRQLHRSNRYNDAPMPFMQRLNWYGVALHAGEIPGYPASHGCIRLPAKFAQKLYEVTELGGFVFVAGGAVGSAEAALKLARANASAPMSADRTPAGASRTAP
ncbi:MAG TPA: L,D-transpeptidase family protein [Allosphingosinicella sp.]|jgi:hypothetical protein